MVQRCRAVLAMNCVLASAESRRGRPLNAIVSHQGNSVAEITPEELEAMSARCAAATPGPWQSFVEGRDHTSGSSFIRTAGKDIDLLGATINDQDFIANARQDLPRLIEEVIRLRAWKP